jgi:hypothetical protein
MVKNVEAAIRLVIHYLLLYNILTPPGHLCKRIIVWLFNRTLHLFYHDESLNM